MSLYPQDHATFIKWAEELSLKMTTDTKGQVRIGKNKLAAMMAATLPNTSKGFNIHTLKSALDNEKPESLSLDKHIAINIDEIMHGNVSSDLNTFLEMYAHIIAQTIKLESIKSVYSIINKNGLIDDFFDDCFDKPSDEKILYAIQNSLSDSIKSILSSLKLDDSKDNAENHFNSALNKATGYAYKEHLLQKLNAYLQCLYNYFHCVLNNDSYSINEHDFNHFIAQAIYQFNMNLKDESIENAINLLLPKFKFKFEINVRAILTDDVEIIDGYEFSELWDVYDACSNSDGESTIRASTLVEVEALNEDEAIDLATQDAPLLCEAESIEIWVDRNIDITRL